MKNESVKLKFLGATGTVTGSKYLLTVNDKKILIDCGLFQGLKQLRLRNWQPVPVDPKEIDCVLFTHAHIDHTGYFPRFVKEGFAKTAYATRGTRALSCILLPDSAHLQEEEAYYLNKHKLSKHHPALPLYTVDEANKALNQIKIVEWDETLEFHGIKIRFRSISHLLGAAFIEIEVYGKKIVFSGDIGRNKDPLLQERSILESVDYLVVESTYGDRLHPPENAQDRLEKIINQTIQRKGIVLVPTFAVGRAQDVLYYIHKLKEQNKIPDVPVYLNSPMAIEATQTYIEYANDLKIPLAELRDIFSKVHYVKDPAESKKLNDSKKPSIILSASGMITGGRILHHIKAMGPDEKNSIVIVGFQAAGTRGEALLRGKREIKIHGQYIPINAQVHYVQNLSAHADYQEILTWLKHIKNPPKNTFITHGEPCAADEMRMHIQEELKWECCVPDYKDEFELL